MTVGRKIADNQRNSYLAGLIVGLILYLVLLSFNDWNPVAVVTNVVFLEFSVVTGLVMRFLSGLGLALTYATFGVLFFRLVSPTLRGSKSRLNVAKLVVLIPALIFVFYAIYKIWGALFLSQPLTYFEFLSTIFGVWSLMIMVYTVPIIKNEYTPDLERVVESYGKQVIGSFRYGRGIRHNSGEIMVVLQKGNLRDMDHDCSCYGSSSVVYYFYPYP
ncbi:MAG: hypothetical protein ACW98U_14625 [Candidatus Thorarchaeota archaeon]|jgi:hypothetical protein